MINKAEGLKDLNTKKGLDFLMPVQQKWTGHCTFSKGEGFHRRLSAILVSKVIGNRKPKGESEEDHSPKEVLSSRWGNAEEK